MPPSDSSAPLELLLAYLRRTRGFDFTGYKRSTLTRRIEKRLQRVGLPDVASYIDFLEVHPDEFALLFDTILINVTGFFRDPAAWEFLSAEILPRIVAGKSRADAIRVWSAGCATGEEAYSIAMALGELLGPDQLRERVKIYATDADEGALSYARHATYTSRQVEGIPAPLLERYFEPANDSYAFRKDLRRVVIFGRHDLVQDAPISRIDLLSCRNTLMYFNTETQERILSRFHFALNDGGYLCLGRAESMSGRAQAFSVVDPKRRIYVKVPGVADRNRTAAPQIVAGPGSELVLARTVVRDAAFDASAVAQIAVDLHGTMVAANERARELFGLAPSDVGRALQDLRISYRPVELRSLIEQACADDRIVGVHGVEWRTAAEESRWLDIQVVPLLNEPGRAIGVTVTFADVSSAKRLQRDLEQSNHDLGAAYEELQSTVEELETTNEELQSTVEELETTNEELQSANEELETMNEELQSTNEELISMNDELRVRSNDLNGANSFLEAILRSLRGAVTVIDRELRIVLWSEWAEDLWGLRRDEVLGRHLLSLEIGLPLQPLRQPIRAILTDGAPLQEVTLLATNRRGRAIECLVSCRPLTSDVGAARGVILFMEEHTTRQADAVSPADRADGSSARVSAAEGDGIGGSTRT